jgi:hypothetical protein
MGTLMVAMPHLVPALKRFAEDNHGVSVSLEHGSAVSMFMFLRASLVDRFKFGRD